MNGPVIAVYYIVPTLNTVFSMQVGTQYDGYSVCYGIAHAYSPVARLDPASVRQNRTAPDPGTRAPLNHP